MSTTIHKPKSRRNWVRRIIMLSLFSAVVAAATGMTAGPSQAATGVTVTLPTTTCSSGVSGYADAQATGNAYLTAPRGTTFTWTTTVEAYYGNAWHSFKQGAVRTENGGGGARGDSYDIWPMWDGYYVHVVFWIWDYQYHHWVAYPGNFCQIHYL